MTREEECIALQQIERYFKTSIFYVIEDVSSAEFSASLWTEKAFGEFATRDQRNRVSEL